ncbi:MAG: hypothetical protein C7B43_04690 [Sulfobacillus benefaciens]|uniref:Sulfatase N-terminal domain-containing protein n=1 Tax=Sulfobacillus benefaciens TaxID=453960 RepID=A0A2T2X8E9_9FIRM|nr:MAG: hypothetical protein C7B43_04690 [Sulfobacillus benefaciens]
MSDEKPNILLILADEHRADCLRAYGNEEIETPTLDFLADNGVVFDQAFCSSPLCAPSRYSILTGLYPHQHLGWDNGSSIPTDVPTFPRVLQAHGYRTQAIGKMHLTPTYMDVGFDAMTLAEQNGMGRFEDDYHRYLREHDLIDYVDLIDQVDMFRQRASKRYWDSFGSEESNLPEWAHSTAWIGRTAVEHVAQWRGGGNFLMLSFVKPHHPFDPPYPWSMMYNPDRLTLLPGWTETNSAADLHFHSGFFPHKKLTENALKAVMAMYYASISHVDFYIGEVLETLKKKGLYDNTLIIYTSDHGEYMGFHHLLLKENHMYDPVVRIPLIMKPLYQTSRPTRNDQLVSNIDLANTILGHVGMEPMPYSNGSNLLDKFPSREYIVAEELSGRQYMVRTANLKLILRRDAKNNMLFDLRKDPMETHNVYDESYYGNDRRKLKNYLSQHFLFECPSTPYHVNEPMTELRLTQVRETLRWTEEKFTQFSTSNR